MSKIIKVDEVTDLSVFTKFAKDEGMFQIEASVYSMVTEVPGTDNKYDHDVTEIELSFLINDKKVTYNGFKTLYNQLFGDNTFVNFWDEKCDEFVEAYLKTTPYKTE